MRETILRSTTNISFFLPQSLGKWSNLTFAYVSNQLKPPTRFLWEFLCKQWPNKYYLDGSTFLTKLWFCQPQTLNQTGVFAYTCPLNYPVLLVNRQYIECFGLRKPHFNKIILEPQTTIYKWMFQLDDSKSLHRKWLFHPTSIYKWLFGVPGLYRNSGKLI